MQFPDAIYHAVARGNGRQKIVFDDRDYRKLLDGIEAIVDKFDFEILSFVCMPNQSRDITAWLARRLAVATLRELVEPFWPAAPGQRSQFAWPCRSSDATIGEAPKRG